MTVNTNIKPGQHEHLREWLLDQFPPEDCSMVMHKFIRVDMQAGDNIKPHKHKHHAVLYYPDQAEAVIVTPQPGTLIYMPPDTVHEVPQVQRARQSFAMLVNP